MCWFTQRLMASGMVARAATASALICAATRRTSGELRATVYKRSARKRDQPCKSTPLDTRTEGIQFSAAKDARSGRSCGICRATKLNTRVPSGPGPIVASGARARRSWSTDNSAGTTRRYSLRSSGASKD